jgi:hypothetical protein
VITRRGFLGILGGFAATEVARKIYVLPPARGWNISPGEALFYLPPSVWSYRYSYRNTVTGHVSDATPDIARLVHNFYSPEMDVIYIYRALGNGEFKYSQTAMGVKG